MNEQLQECIDLAKEILNLLKSRQIATNLI